MAKIAYDELWVCTDCAQVIANGPYGMDLTPERLEDITTYGLDQAEGYWALDDDSETGEGIHEFSTRQCDGCGDWHGGGRYRAVVLTD